MAVVGTIWYMLKVLSLKTKLHPNGNLYVYKNVSKLKTQSCYKHVFRSNLFSQNMYALLFLPADKIVLNQSFIVLLVCCCINAYYYLINAFLQVWEFLAALKTHWWPLAVVCSLVGLLSL